MKPATFEYYAPATLAEAVGLLRDLDDAKPIAGGQSLVPMQALRLARFDQLVDLGRIAELVGVERRGDVVRVGAMTTQAVVGRHPEIAASVPLLARATPLVGHFQIRNRGTIGGSLAHADPAAEYPAVALALDAEIEVAGSDGHRMVPAREFFVSMWTTVLGPDEIVAAVHLPVRRARSGYAVAEVARRHGDFALAGVACALELEGGRVARVGLGLLGLAHVASRATAAEEALVGVAVGDVDPGALARMAAAALDPPEDIHASAAYRRHVAVGLITRVLRDALREAARG